MTYVYSQVPQINHKIPLPEHQVYLTLVTEFLTITKGRVFGDLETILTGTYDI